MEVNKSGINPNTWTKQVKCPLCEAGLNISWKDISMKAINKETFLSRKRILQYYIKCAECGSKIEIDENELPYIIRKKIYNNMDTVDRVLSFYF